jgi:hypothetical protein
VTLARTAQRCSAVEVDFFPPDPETAPFDEVEPARQPWQSAPDNEFPALSPATEILATTAHVAVALTGIRVFSDGIEISITRHLRRLDLGYREWTELSHAFMENRGGMGRQVGRLRFGVVLPDGRALRDGWPGFGDPPAGDPRATLVRTGGGSGGGSHSFTGSDTLWLWPLPPAGPLELVLQWPDLGIPETRTIIDASPFAEFAARVTPIWPT